MNKPLFTSVNEFNAHAELFFDPDRSDLDNRGPFLIVCDDFYPDAQAIRQLALAQRFYQYKPPLAEQVGEEVAAQYRDRRPMWLASALLRHLGENVAHPQPGFRHASAEVREALSGVTREKVDLATWHDAGDWWNGAFHIQYALSKESDRLIHHHFREGDLSARGWSGLVYLSPDAPPECGTTFWREKHSGRCTATLGRRYDRQDDSFELALSVENKFNRLVLFRENVLHRACSGFGDTRATARLSQTFFFHAQPPCSGGR